ncbi:hypothetical protein B1F77_13105, partial [Pseudomonas syringae]
RDFFFTRRSGYKQSCFVWWAWRFVKETVTPKGVKKALPPLGHQNLSSAARRGMPFWTLCVLFCDAERHQTHFYTQRHRQATYIPDHLMATYSFSP